jgi:AmiR/NasT family two-component response regulator
VLAAQLQTALDSRVVIEQAKGVLAERLGFDMNTAFSTLRNVARRANRRLSEVAREVVEGRGRTDLIP